MKIIIEVPGPPVSKNKGVRFDPKSQRMFRPKEATEWMRRIRAIAQFAAIEARWPDPFRVAEVAISFRKYDCRHDSGAGNEYVFDALQIPTRKQDRAAFRNSWGLYANDRDAWTRESPPPIRDGSGRRCIFEIELLALRSDEEAQSARERWEATIRREHERAVARQMRAITGRR